MTTFPAPSPPYVGPPKFHGPQTNKPINRIVIHGTVSRCYSGGAMAICSYFRRNVIRPSSVHYVVDPSFTRQLTYDSWVAYGAPPNEHSIHIELCDGQGPNYGRWHGPLHRMMLRRAARLTARLCLAYGVPAVKLDAHALTLGRRGICGHVDVSHAFHETTHTDPGPGFPWQYFMDKVLAKIDKLEKR